MSIKGIKTLQTQIYQTSIKLKVQFHPNYTFQTKVTSKRAIS